MYKKFQSRFLLNTFVVVGVVFGFSHQMMAQFSEHHHEACEHSHADHEHYDESPDSESPDQLPCDDCPCHVCGPAFVTQLSAPNASRAPTFSRSEISGQIALLYSPPLGLGIDHPPQG